MVDKIKNNFPDLNNKYISNSSLPAKKRLLEYTQKMDKSDFCHSYTRYSIELKLLDDAINEAGELDKASVSELEKRKSVVVKSIEEMGYVIK